MFVLEVATRTTASNVLKLHQARVWYNNTEAKPAQAEQVCTPELQAKSKHPYVMAYAIGICRMSRSYMLTDGVQCRACALAVDFVRLNRGAATLLLLMCAERAGYVVEPGAQTNSGQ